MNSQSVNNKFNYASNNPISYSDPTGRASVFGWLAAVAFPFQALIAMNTSNFFQDNFGFSSGDIKAFNSATLAVDPLICHTDCLLDIRKTSGRIYIVHKPSLVLQVPTV